ncbi:ABC transporter permease [Chelativorans alearense]|uniref:ABC transporter permease n=1 Tax=Chelativorans alearense TaxID=2681495 RepID=UPI0013D38F20|nr:ABC transporter permease subunit [Chelativorans alearense]
MLAFPTASETLAPPHAVILGFFGIVTDGTLALQTAQTLSSALGGLAIGFTLGSLLGAAFGLWRWFDRAMQISVESVRLIPSVALIPLSMMVFGFGTRMEITIVAFTTQWPAMVLARAAVREVEPRLMEVATVLQMSLLQSATKIVLPSILPRLFVSLRLTAGVAMIVAITVEVAANPYGLGAAILAAQISFRPEVMLATLIWTGVVGAGINQVLLTTQNRLFRHSLPGGGGSE